jgi:hypothetical protein
MQREWHQTIIEIKAKTRQLVLARMLRSLRSAFVLALSVIELA